jgi:hypothetical protein
MSTSVVNAWREPVAALFAQHTALKPKMMERVTFISGAAYVEPLDATERREMNLSL